MAKKRNIIVGQSGGPTAVINSSLAGVYKNAIERGFDKVYGMLHGIQGLLDEQYIDLSTQIHSELDIELLKRTPSAFLGSCRYKLPEIHEDKAIYEKIFEILNKLDIYAFIYIGGNDSMDTIKKLSDYAILTGQTQKFLGVPKTIDNDLALTDHTPGFGSAAKYIGASTKEVIRDALGLTYKKNMITIMEIMGRNAGWLTGATALAKSEDCDGPDLIYLPEVPFDVEKFLAKVKDLLNKKASIVIAVSEGIKLADGRYVCELGSVGDYVDAFGHKQLQGTATYLANFLAAECGKLFFHQLLHSGIKHGRHLVKDHAFDMAFLFVLHKTFDISCQGNTHSSAVYHKDDRSICGICQVIGACFRGYSTHAVIIAHNTFHHCNIAVCCIFSKQVSGSLGICKKGIQISGFRPDDSGMKHGIYIIRSAFKRCHFHFSIDQCLQKSAGDQCFATAAGSCCKKYSWNIHPCSPLFLSYIFSTISGHSNLLTVNLYFLNC